jgi:hypothetical protein
MSKNQKRFYFKPHTGSKWRYQVRYHDGKKLYKDLSRFFDLHFVRNKRELLEFVTVLKLDGYETIDAFDYVAFCHEPTLKPKTTAQRVERICRKIYFNHRCKNRTVPPDAIVNGEDVHAITLWQATRLWNWIDRQDEPEQLWAIMLEYLPFAFKQSGDVNSIAFTYAPGTVFAFA